MDRSGAPTRLTDPLVRTRVTHHIRNRGEPMIVVDAQVHPFAANTPERPWARQMPEAVHLPEVTRDQMVAAMAAAGVDRAIAVSPVRVYDFDASYAEEIYR